LGVNDVVLELSLDNMRNVSIKLACQLAQVALNLFVQHLLDLAQVVKALHEGLVVEFAERELLRVVAEVLNTLLDHLLVVYELNEIGHGLFKGARVLLALHFLLLFFLLVFAQVHLDLCVAFLRLFFVLLIILLDQLVKRARILKLPHTLHPNSAISGPESVLATAVNKCLRNIELALVVFDITPHEVA